MSKQAMIFGGSDPYMIWQVLSEPFNDTKYTNLQMVAYSFCVKTNQNMSFKSGLNLRRKQCSPTLTRGFMHGYATHLTCTNQKRRRDIATQVSVLQKPLRIQKEQAVGRTANTSGWNVKRPHQTG